MEAPQARSNKEVLVEFYTAHDAAKVEKVDAILAGWPLLELLEALRKKYGEVPDLIIDPPVVEPPAVDDTINSSDDSDIVCTFSDIKKVKKKKKKKNKEKGLEGEGEEGLGEEEKAKRDAKKAKKDKKNKDKLGAVAKLPAGYNALQVLAVNIAKPPTAKNIGQKWWNQAVSEVSDIKRRLTKKAMGFVDEAVRRSLEEKARQMAELREARHRGAPKESVIELIEDDVEKPEPVRRRRREPSPDAGNNAADDGDRQLDGDYRAPSPEADEGDGSDDDDLERMAKRQKKEESLQRKATQKEAMQEALIAHFKKLEEDKEDGKVPEGFENWEAFNAAKAHALAHGNPDDASEQSDGTSGDTSEDEYREDPKKKRVLDYWGAPPEELLERNDLEDSLDGSRAYVAHFVRYVVGTWHSHFKQGIKIEGNKLSESVATSFNTGMVVEKTKESLTPLLVHLQRNSVPLDLLKKLDGLCTLAARRDYKTCMQEYVVVTMGRKTWHQSMAQDMKQQNHGGSICRIIKQSQFVDFDFDPTVNAYVLALKRVIIFLQWLRPPTNPSLGSY